MSNQTKIVICLFSCLLLMSIPFINCVQANEIKKEIKEKQENFMDSYIEKFRLFESKLGIENNEEMPVVTSIILFIFWIYWYFFQ